MLRRRGYYIKHFRMFWMHVKHCETLNPFSRLQNLFRVNDLL